jgi:uracil-DNA glycosylase
LNLAARSTGHLLGEKSGQTFSPEAPADCGLCPRLVTYRHANQAAEPTWFNGAVPSFGGPDARLLIVGLAPGVKGANRTGRPFTGDYAGTLLYETLLSFGFAQGRFDARIDDGLQLVDCMVSNAVRCVPPENKPTPAEINTCRGYLSARIAAMTRLKAIVVLGRIAHESTLTALKARKAAFPFTHAARHVVTPELTIYDSYHCSRYNTNTGRLTTEMFRSVFAAVRTDLDKI